MNNAKDINIKKQTLNKVLVSVIVILAIVAITTISYAAWSNKLEATNTFSINSAEVTHLSFGGADGVEVIGVAEPGAVVYSPEVKVASNNEDLKVTFAITSVSVKLEGSEEYLPIEDAYKNIFTLIVTNTDNTVTKQGVNMVFNFKMQDKVDTKYSQASFKITVSATAVKA